MELEQRKDVRINGHLMCRIAAQSCEAEIRRNKYTALIKFDAKGFFEITHFDKNGTIIGREMIT